MRAIDHLKTLAERSKGPSKGALERWRRCHRSVDAFRATDDDRQSTTRRAMTVYDDVAPLEATTLRSERKAAFVTELFDRVARRYDVVNAMIACGFVARWRRRALRCGLDVFNALDRARTIERGDVVLDVGCGTGAVTATVMYGELSYLGAEVTGFDCSPGMLREARRAMPNARWDLGNAAKMTAYEDASFDCVFTAYTLRNFSDFDATMEEMYRVCKPGGRVVILDAFPPSGVFGFVLRTWLRFALPIIGNLITGERKAYEYLGSSIEMARTPEEVSGAFRNLGAERVEAARMFPFGAAGMIVAFKPS